MHGEGKNKVVRDTIRDIPEDIFTSSRVSISLNKSVGDCFFF